METGHFLIQLLGKHLNARFTGTTGLPEVNLGEALVSKAVGHDETWVSGRAAKIHEPAFGEHVESIPSGKGILIHLGLDV